MQKIMMFLKFGKEKDICDLYNNGTIYMSSIQRFREIEDGELRGDLYEGVSYIRNYLPGSFEIPSIGYKGNHLGIHIKESYESVLGNIYSLYCISSHGWKDPNDFYIDEKIKKFGSHCLMIKNNPKFLALIEEKLNQLKLKFTHNFVKYYDKNTVNRQISLFEKPLEFEYQKEFRFYIERDSTEPFVFSIGSLEEISKVFSTDQIVNELKLEKEII
ncbi:MAG: hypothetical protein WC755_06270 [Candidatus Woesearchaeota archaeon]